MNSTQYTTDQLRSIIIPSLAYLDSDVIIISPYSIPLIEFDYTEPVIIDNADGETLITIDFHQLLMHSCGPECCGAFTESYTIILTKEKINELLIHGNP